MPQELHVTLDMDGTFVNLYGVPDWLPKLRAHDSSPYRIAKPLVDMRKLVRILKQLQAKGNKVGIVSWLAMETTPTYDQQVTLEKQKYLARHAGSITFDFIHIVPYGTPKHELVKADRKIIFDDNHQIITAWEQDGGIGHHVVGDNLLDALARLL